MLADSGNVMLSTGGQMFLNFSGTDTINQLFFNGFAISLTGTWGSTASALPIQMTRSFPAWVSCWSRILGFRQ